MGRVEADIRNLGIMGGSFDPIHCGHLAVAEASRVQFNLERVVFVPAYCPPHKSVEDLTPAEHRFAMVNLAIAHNPYFSSSPIEVERSCPTYAGHTIEAFHEIYGKGWKLYFITGLDAILTIINWERARTYPGICHFIAATRPGYSIDEIVKSIPEAFKSFVSILEEPRLMVSSTEIRSRVRSGESIDDMVPPEVREYIFHFKIYTDGKVSS